MNVSLSLIEYTQGLGEQEVKVRNLEDLKAGKTANQEGRVVTGEDGLGVNNYLIIYYELFINKNP